MAESLQYQEDPSGLFIRAQGHITAAISTDLREVVLERLSMPPIPQLVAVDLENCDYMDSTFMGLLVGFHKRFRALTGKSLTILRPSKECAKLLMGLGILKLMDLVEGPNPVSPTEWQTIRKSQSPTPEIILGAHRNLSELSPENEQKFSALQSVLEGQLKNEPK